MSLTSLPSNIIAALVALGVFAAVSVFAYHEHDALVKERGVSASLNETLTGIKLAQANQREHDKQSASDVAAKCDTRVNEARRSALAIKKLTEPTHATNPSSASIIGADELRNALQPAAS